MGLPGQINQNHRSTGSDDLFYQIPLDLGKQQIWLVSTGKCITHISLFSFQCGVETDTYNGEVTGFCQCHSFGDTVVLEYLSYGRVIIEQTSLCIIDIPAGILADSCNSFHYSDGTGRGTVVVTNQCGHDCRHWGR